MIKINKLISWYFNIIRLELPDKCPYCKSKQSDVIKKWTYNNIKVTRLKCDCGKIYNLYESPKSTWTIPKGKK